MTAVCVFAGATAEAKEFSTVVCVEYSGESDKPVWPLVIAPVRPSRQDLSGLLSTNADPEFINLVILPEPDVRRLAREVQRCCDGRESTADNSVPALLLVTIFTGSAAENSAGAAGGGGRITRQLHRNVAIGVLQVLGQFQATDIAAGNDLKQAVTEFRKRTQLEQIP